VTVADIAALRAAAPDTARPDRRPRICVLALSPIADDPRVRRQAEAFHRAGWQVIAVGLPGARSPEPEWPIVTREEPLSCNGFATVPPAAGAADDGASPIMRLRLWIGSHIRNLERRIANTRVRHAAIRDASVRGSRGFRLRRRSRAAAVRSLDALALFLRAIRPGRIWYAACLLGVRFRPELAQCLYWSFSTDIRDMYAGASRLEASIWLANDWTALPLAARLARENGGVYGYDTHEFAREEYGERRSWRFWHRPMVCAIEASLIGGAAVVSAVSGGIADQLDQVYRLVQKSLVVRNTPAFETAAFSPTGAVVRVLYHGIVTPGRGLEAAIDSVALWPADFELTIRGPGAADYLDTLRRRIAGSGAAGRVHLAPPVPMTALVREAAAFDIGFFALPGSSRHNQFALPNKLFEYVMAGLAICVSDLPEMARIVRQYDLGVLIASVDPAAIAAAIGRLDRDRIDRYKRRALAAARELCWERESQRLVDAYGAALPASIG
jgi:glycosyltransferase involved in cell wall biosynthesis